jgi:hypothetical protein
MNTEYNYLSFDFTEKQPKKTSSWNCRNKRTKDVLGVVKWYSAWRQYCFFPTCPAVYNNSCLSDISDFLTQLNKERKS